MITNRDIQYIYKENSPAMFDRIYKRYDLLNRLFSFGRDITWRRRLSRRIAAENNREPLNLLDLAAGTGDVALDLLKLCPRIQYAYGCDPARKMLELAGKKAVKKKLSAKLFLLQGDAGNIPFINDIFNVVTMAFGIRNVADPARVLTEIARVLKKGGRALILEFSLPANTVVRKLHLFYLRHIIPRVGAAISRDKHAYRYLDKTIETFPYGQSFCGLMKAAGFRNVRCKPFTFGVATLYQGDK